LPPLVGVIGKTNVGKTTFFTAATLVDAQISNHPFTTIEPNVGIAYVRKECVCKRLSVKDNPVNSTCIEGYRFIPVKLIDVAGLIPGAHTGRGLGNKFLDDLRKADALIHVVDAAGSTDAEGRPVKPGTYDPIEDVKFVEYEINTWIYQILKRDWERFARYVDTQAPDTIQALAERLSGLSVKRTHVVKALKEAKLEGSKLTSWSDEDLKKFASEIRRASKPIIIAANKADLPEAVDNIKRMIKEFRDNIIVPTSSEAELALKRASRKGLIKYLPGDKTFSIIDESRLTDAQKRALRYINERVFKVWGDTGVQKVINETFFNALNMIVVYPVEDQSKLTDHKGNVLPDALLVERGTTARELAYMIHSDLGESFLYAINVWTKQRVGEDYELKDNDIIKIVAVKARH